MGGTLIPRLHLALTTAQTGSKDIILNITQIFGLCFTTVEVNEDPLSHLFTFHGLKSVSAVTPLLYADDIQRLPNKCKQLVELGQGTNINIKCFWQCFCRMLILFFKEGESVPF